MKFNLSEPRAVTRIREALLNLKPVYIESSSRTMHRIISIRLSKGTLYFRKVEGDRFLLLETERASHTVHIS